MANRYNTTVNPDNPVKTVKEFVGRIAEVKNYFAPSNDKNEIPYTTVYRGQKDVKFKLVSSLHRKCIESIGRIDGKQCKKMEEAIVDEASRHYPDEFKNLSCYIEQLTWLQHYGFPTRLLDVTGNALVALFFATESVSDKDGVEKDGKVYVVGVTRWEREWATLPSDKNLRNCTSDLFVKKQAIGLQGAIRNNRKTYGPRLIMPPFLTERQRRQCGMFYLMSNCISESDARVEHNKGRCLSGEDSGTLVQEILIDRGSKECIRHELEDDFGITRHFLFPESPSDMVEETLAHVQKRLSYPPLTIP